MQDNKAIIYNSKIYSRSPAVGPGLIKVGNTYSIDPAYILELVNSQPEPEPEDVQDITSTG